MPIASRCLRVLLSLCALMTGASALAAPVDSGALALTVVANNASGISINVVTGATGNDASPPAGWDFNIYSTTPTTAVALFWPTTPALSHGGVATGSIYSVLTAGEVVGPNSTFITTAGASAMANFQTSTGRKALGIRFFNETGGTLHYGYVVIDTTASTGLPATIRRIVYESTPNAPITVPHFCGANATIVSILDIDGDCVVDPLTDGLLLTRAMMGLTGTAVTNNAIGAGATRTTWTQIRTYLTQQFGSNYLP